MPTPFHFEHTFRAPSTAVVFAGYFDPELSAEQDRRVDIARRDVLEDVDAPDQRRRVCKVIPRRQLPAIIRPFIPGDLSYVERLVWHKAEDRIAQRIEPSILGGKVEIVTEYRLLATGPGAVRRTLAGQVTVELALIGGRVERAILEDLERSMGIAAIATQEWLDRCHPPPR